MRVARQQEVGPSGEYLVCCRTPIIRVRLGVVQPTTRVVEYTHRQRSTVVILASTQLIGRDHGLKLRESDVETVFVIIASTKPSGIKAHETDSGDGTQSSEVRILAGNTVGRHPELLAELHI
jgi:hypothetical protein